MREEPPEADWGEPWTNEGVALADATNLSHAQWSTIEHWHNRFSYISPAVDQLPSDGVLGDADFAAAEQQYVESDPGVTVIDDILSPQALQSLLLYAWESTIWLDTKAGYVGAYWSYGMGGALITEFVRQLRLAMPRVLCEHRLTEMWLFKYDDELASGVQAHADSAAVNIKYAPHALRHVHEPRSMPCDSHTDN